MEYYETEPMSEADCGEFIKWFVIEIGTDYEENEIEDNQWYILFCDLIPEEVEKIRAYEIAHRIKKTA